MLQSRGYQKASLLDVLLASVDPDHVLGAGVDALVGLSAGEAWVQGRPGGHQELLLVRANTKCNQLESSR